MAVKGKANPGMHITDLPAPENRDPLAGRLSGQSKLTALWGLRNVENDLKESFNLRFGCGAYKYKLIFISL